MKNMKKIVVCIIIAILLLFLGTLYVSTARAIEMQYIDRQFHARIEADHGSASLGVFAPQYVTVLERQSDWVRIDTYRGPGFVFTGAIEAQAVKFIERTFPARIYPNHGSTVVGMFAPQYVNVIGSYGYWVQIQTYAGDAWVYAGETQERRWTDYDVIVLSRMVWGEGRGVSRNEQKLIVWTAINRYEHRFANAENGLTGIVRSPGQFVGYSSWFPVTPEIREVVVEVLEAWDQGEQAKVYPPFSRCPHYVFFSGHSGHNWFRSHYRGSHCNFC